MQDLLAITDALRQVPDEQLVQIRRLIENLTAPAPSPAAKEQEASKSVAATPPQPERIAGRTVSRLLREAGPSGLSLAEICNKLGCTARQFRDFWRKHQPSHLRFDRQTNMLTHKRLPQAPLPRGRFPYERFVALVRETGRISPEELAERLRLTPAQIKNAWHGAIRRHPERIAGIEYDAATRSYRPVQDAAASQPAPSPQPQEMQEAAPREEPA